jgi:hypothetical protein
MSSPTQTPLWIELLKSLPSIVTAVTAIVGVSIAKAGLDKWRAETLGKRKADLAEQALIAFNEAKDVFVWVRSPGIMGGEGESRQAHSDESPSQQRQRNTYFIPIERLNHARDLFARLQALKYAFAAHFGENARKPFEMIHEAHTTIITAAGILIQMTVDDEGGTLNRHDSMMPLVHDIFGAPERPDKLDKKVEDALNQIDEYCRPVLASKS